MKLVVQVVGPRKSGKTTLITYLIKELIGLGIEPIVVKQTKHKLEQVDAGDTKRFTVAGAPEVWLLTPNGLRLQARLRPSVQELVENLEGLIIFEGGKELKVREWYSIITWKNEVDKMRYWKPNTIADMGPDDDARLLAWRLARLLATLARARLSRSLYHPSTLGKLLITRTSRPRCREERQ